jgi:hypothetical protein
VNLVLLVWFSAELFNGPELGLAERVVAGYQAAWPLVVVASVVAVQLRVSEQAAAEESVRSS